MQRITFLLAFLISLSVFSQESKEIIKIIDELRYSWDDEAEKLETYEGLGEFCGNSVYRKKIIGMLDDIHHYDTLLYGIVTRKFDKTEDAEAKATLDDIETLEVDYTTKSFRRFIHKECNTYNEIENNLSREGGVEYKKEVKTLEAELKKYVKEITKQIDIIDEHVHHLHLDD
ncbi:MAG: hypothetical protein Tsb0034_00630 [Ekhidna sp.]